MSASRSAAKATRNSRSSLVCTVSSSPRAAPKRSAHAPSLQYPANLLDGGSLASAVLLLFAGDADARPRDGIEPRGGDGFPAIPAQAVGPLLHALEGFFDRLQDLGVGLFQLQLDVHLVGAGRLV